MYCASSNSECPKSRHPITELVRNLDAQEPKMSCASSYSECSKSGRLNTELVWNLDAQKSGFWHFCIKIHFQTIKLLRSLNLCWFGDLKWLMQYMCEVQTSVDFRHSVAIRFQTVSFSDTVCSEWIWNLNFLFGFQTLFVKCLKTGYFLIFFLRLDFFEFLHSDPHFK